MVVSSTATVEQELFEKVALLSSAQKREALDFVTFLSSRRLRRTKTDTSSARQKKHSIAAIFDLAVDCKDTDLSTNHDTYLYGKEAQ
jgi:hypothetical protein